MKRIHLILLSFCIFLFETITVNAMTLKPSGDSSAKRGEEITLFVELERGADEKKVSAVDGVFNYDKDVFSLVSFSNLMNNWIQLSDFNNKKFSYANLTFDNLINVTKQNIVEVVLKIKEDAKLGDSTISISSPNATDENGDSVLIQGKLHTIKILSDANSGNTTSDIGNDNSETIENKKSDNNYLSELNSDEIDIVFSKQQLVYQAAVLYEIDEIDFEFTKEDPKALVEIVGNTDLKVGKNTITIIVTAEDGSVREYKIIVTRKEENKVVSNNSKLKDLIISGYKLEFDSNKFDYILKIKDEEQLNILYTKADIGSNVKIEGNKSLVDKGIITITVTAEDQTTTTYKIKVEKDNNNIYLFLVGIVLLLVIIALTVYLIIKRKKKKQLTKIV